MRYLYSLTCPRARDLKRLVIWKLLKFESCLRMQLPGNSIKTGSTSSSQASLYPLWRSWDEDLTAAVPSRLPYGMSSGTSECDSKSKYIHWKIQFNFICYKIFAVDKINDFFSNIQNEKMYSFAYLFFFSFQRGKM